MIAQDDLSRVRFLALLGPLSGYMNDPSVLNVNVNEDGAVWLERRGGVRERAPEKISITQREALISFLATSLGRSVDQLHSRLSCDMPYFDARVQAFAPPVSAFPLMIRKHAQQIYTLDDYVQSGTMTLEVRETIASAVAAEKNIVVSGRMGSGKTTLLNACMHEAARLRPAHRCVIIQDRAELKASAENHLYLFARVEQGRWSNGTLSRYTYDFPDVLEDALRTDAQYLVWGELRDGLSALGLFMALNTGTRGFLTTIHADNAHDTLHRIEDLLASIGRTPQSRSIARSIHTIVHMDRDESTGKRYVREVAEVLGVDGAGEYVIAGLKEAGPRISA